MGTNDMFCSMHVATLIRFLIKYHMLGSGLDFTGIFSLLCHMLTITKVPRWNLLLFIPQTSK
jgi:hypothetical protein